MSFDAVVSVSSLVGLLQELIEENFVEVLVQGEIAGFSRAQSGHCYFTLKDQRAQLRCAMFRGFARALRFTPENGMEVICRGRVSVYPQRGEMQLVVEGVEPVGVGSLQLAFQQLQSKLEREGLFAAERKRPLPSHPAVIGVVTSASGAAIHDILNILRRRAAGVRVLLRSVPVQGEGAAAQIAEAIADLNREGSAEVLIVGRGGGSAEDLWAFNEELVARAIAASRVPVISAVGHEVDLSIADLVADLRAPTPSAAAELVIKHRLELQQHLDQLVLRLNGQIRSRLELLRLRLTGLERRLKSPAELIARASERLQYCEDRLQNAMLRLLDARRQQFALLTVRLQDLSPLEILQRGYAIVRVSPQGTVLRDPAQVCPGDRLHVELAKGSVSARVVGGETEELHR